ncbi:MAG: hypothetical protein IT373_01925 [Polyangiaceae bacterium]|nr:hypothetical protein [Polyangiaceae bacterium]
MARHDCQFWQQRVLRAVLALEQAEGAGARAARGREAFSALRELHPTPASALLGLDALQWRRIARRIGRTSRSFEGIVAGYWDSALALGVLVGLVYACVATEGVAVIYPVAGRLVLTAWRVMTRG